METAGEWLRRERLRQKLTFTQISQITRIPIKALRAIEKNRFGDLPGQTYSQGFIKNYAQALNLDPERILAMFRRDFNLLKSKPIMPEGLAKPLGLAHDSRLTGTFLSIVLVVIVAAAYLGWSVFKLYQPPQLSLDQPTEAATLSSPVVVIGQTDRDASLTLNGQTVSVEPDGKFTTTFESLPGVSTITLKATSRRGKTATLERHVIIQK